MKKGKTTKLNIFENAKCFFGTVDSKELKTIYVVLQTWVEPQYELENWTRVTGSIKRQIQHTLLEVIDPIYFNKNNIVDLDLRTSGIQVGKKSFLNLEITLFVKDKTMDFKSPIIKNKIKNIITAVYNDDLYRCKYFSLSKSKDTKQTTEVE